MIATITNKMIDYFGNDVRRINHALKVYSFAKVICELENVSAEQKTIIELTALLHDIGIKVAEQKYNSCAGNYQEMEGPAVAKELLFDIDLSAETKNRICFIIGNHHSLSKIDGIDFQIIVEADFLVNIYEDEISVSTSKNIMEKYFKTNSGKQILTNMYL